MKTPKVCCKINHTKKESDKALSFNGQITMKFNLRPWYTRSASPWRMEGDGFNAQPLDLLNGLALGCYQN